MDEIVWATIIIWFFLIAIGYATKNKIFQGSSAVVGFVLMVLMLAENFLLALTLMAINIYLLYMAIFAKE